MGTWKAEYEYGQHMVHDEDGRLVMATHDRRVALLVAAAPKLLAACETGEDLLAFHEGSARPGHDGACPTVRINGEDLARVLSCLRDAIREARGEAA